MSEEVTPVVVAPEPTAPVVAAPAPEAADPDWLPARLERAKKSATKDLLEATGLSSVDELRAVAEKAKQFDAIEAASKTEMQRAIERAEEAERKATELESRAAAAEIKALRTSIGTAKGIPSALIDMLTATDEDGITAQADAILAAIPAPPNHAAIHDVMTDPDAGKTPEERALIAAFRGKSK